MTLTISILFLLVFFIKKEKADLFYAGFYLLFPVLSYIDINHLGIAPGAVETQMRPFAILSGASFAMGLAHVIDIRLLKIKTIEHVEAGILFFGLCSLYRSEFYLIASAFMALLYGYERYTRRKNHTSGKVWHCLALILLLFHVTAVEYGGQWAQWLGIAATGTLAASFIATFNPRLLLGTWALLLFAGNTLGASSSLLYFFASLLAILTFLNINKFSQRKIIEKVGDNRAFQRVKVFVFMRNNPAVLKPAMSGASDKVESAPAGKADFVERDNIIWQQAAYFGALALLMAGLHFLEI